MTDIAELYVDFHATLRRRVAARVNASEAIVDDACSHAWLQYLVHRPEPAAVRGWLILVATREVWRLTNLEWRAGAEIPDTAAEYPDRPIDEVHAMRRLAAGDRDLLLASASGLTYGEMADRFGHSMRAIDRRLQRARSRVRALRDCAVTA